MSQSDEDFMRRAIALSLDSAMDGGGPFAAIVVKDGAVIGTGTNRVTAALDPTAHAEVSAIRDACQTIGSHVLSGATIFTTCEPCPMCLAAVYWARIDRMVYGNSREDAAAIGFDDAFLYEQVALPIEARSLPTGRLLAGEAIAAFQAWTDNPDKIPY